VAGCQRELRERHVLPLIHIGALDCCMNQF
jgi:hypothetical protein